MADLMDSIMDYIAEASDDELTDLTRAIELVQQGRARELFREMQDGTVTRVRIKPRVLNKRYLDGAEAEVVATRTTKVEIRFPDDMPAEHDPYQKYAGTRVIVPPIALERVTP